MKQVYQIVFLCVSIAAAIAVDPYYKQASDLIDQLLTDYEVSVPPVVKAGDTVVVKVYPEIIRVEGIDERLDTLSTSISLAQSWNDPRLTWNPNNTGGIQKVHLSLKRIWAPDITLYNVAPESGSIDIADNDFSAIVEYNGDVIHVQFSTLNSYCSLDLTNFPYDIQECEIVMGSWVFHSKEMLMKFMANETISTFDVSFSEYTPTEHPTWILVHKKAKGTLQNNTYPCCPESYQTLTITLKLQRAQQFFKYMLVGPGVILSLLVPLQFLLLPSSTQRLLFGMLIILSITILLTGLEKYFPYEHSSVPKIGIFSVVSMAFAALAIFLSTMISAIGNKGKHRRAMPAWLTRLCLTSKCLHRVLCISGTSPVNSMYSSINSRLLEEMQEPGLEMMSEQDMDQASDGKEMYSNTTVAYMRSIAKSTKITASKSVAEESLERLNSEWHDLARILDRLCFVIFMFMHIIIILGLVAQGDKAT